MIKNKKHTTYLEEKVFPKLKIQRLPDPDKKVYGSKQTNLIRISQEKRIKRLQLAMLGWADKVGITTKDDQSEWRENFTSVLRMERHLSGGLNNTLGKEEKKLANRLYRKYKK